MRMNEWKLFFLIFGNVEPTVERYDGGKPKNLSQCHFVHQKSHWIDPGRRGERPAANRRKGVPTLRSSIHWHYKYVLHATSSGNCCALGRHSCSNVIWGHCALRNSCTDSRSLLLVFQQLPLSTVGQRVSTMGHPTPLLCNNGNQSFSLLRSNDPGHAGFPPQLEKRDRQEGMDVPIRCSSLTL
jgi:hypothetical protein